MKAVVFERYGSPESLTLVDRPPPSVGRNEVLIRVRATSVNPVDWKLRGGSMRCYMPLRLPKILGFDVSGEVLEVGPSVTRFRRGDEVFGMLDLLRDGAYAELVAASESVLESKPRSLSHEEAASIPLAGLTAWQALVKRARVTRKKRVLIIGASGGVGAFGVQIARAFGAHVTGVCSSRNLSFVQGLGANATFAYDTETVDGLFDVIFDASGTSSYYRSHKNLASGGTYVSTVPNVWNVLSVFATCIGRFFGGRSSHLFFTRPHAGDLRELSMLVRNGDIRVPIEGIYSLDEVQRAHHRSQTGRVVGKLAVVVARSIDQIR